MWSKKYQIAEIAFIYTQPNSKNSFIFPWICQSVKTIYIILKLTIILYRVSGFFFLQNFRIDFRAHINIKIILGHLLVKKCFLNRVAQQTRNMHCIHFKQCTREKHLAYKRCFFSFALSTYTVYSFENNLLQNVDLLEISFVP